MLRKQTLRNDDVEFTCGIDNFKLELAARIAQFMLDNPDMPNDELKYYIAIALRKRHTMSELRNET